MRRKPAMNPNRNHERKIIMYAHVKADLRRVLIAIYKGHNQYPKLVKELQDLSYDQVRHRVGLLERMELVERKYLCYIFEWSNSSYLALTDKAKRTVEKELSE